MKRRLNSRHIFRYCYKYYVINRYKNHLPVSLSILMKRPAKDSSLKWIYSIDHKQPFLRLFNILVARLFLNEYITTCRRRRSGNLHEDNCILPIISNQFVRRSLKDTGSILMQYD